jgi:hypothetical protein
VGEAKDMDADRDWDKVDVAKDKASCSSRNKVCIYRELYKDKGTSMMQGNSKTGEPGYRIAGLCRLVLMGY